MDGSAKTPVELVKGINGLNKIVLRGTRSSSVEVYLYGGHVTSWKNDHGEELLFVSSKAIFKPPKAIRGGIPICFPQFGMSGNLEQHGFARNRIWSIDTDPPPFSSNSNHKSFVDLILKSSEEDAKIWPHSYEFRLRITLTLGGDLMLTSRIRNTNTYGKPFSFTFAYHTYFFVSDISEVRVEGLETLDYLDNLKGKERFTEQGDAITFESEMDRIYLSTPNKIAIIDHEKKRTFVLRKEGLPDAVVWTFALYSLICRHANVSLLPNKQVADEELSTYKVECPPEIKGKSWIKNVLEKHKNLHTALLLIVMLGTCMVIGDGVLIPAISVFSAVSGLELSMSNGKHEYAVVPITCFLILCLFALQHYGTHKVGFLFAPIIITWLLCNATLGIYNIFRWNPRVYQALSPYYMLTFLKKTKKGGWMSLGGILLCMTGSEAMFADLGHFSHTAIQIAFTSLVYPALVLGYMGQAAYLSEHHIIASTYQIGFYATVPEIVRWPVLAVAILAAVVGSQTIISGTFSIINQSQSLGCFPRVKVVHTSDKIHGQIYIPEINWMLMILCLAVAIGFRDTKHMGNASGLAVITVMLVTTCLTSLVIVLCWNKPPLLALAFLIFFGSIECLYLSASLIKFREGAWVPILLAFLLMTVMFLWHYATVRKYLFDLQNKVSLDWLLALGESLGIARVPGIGLVYTDLISGVPANFSHFITNLPAFHRVLVFVCVKYIPVPFVPAAERYLVGRVGPPDHRSYRCIVRYGYHDVHQDVDSFESELIGSLADFIRLEASYPSDDNGGLTVVGRTLSIFTGTSNEIEEAATLPAGLPSEGNGEELAAMGRAKKVRFFIENERSTSTTMDRRVREELHDLQEACEAGTAFIMGHSHVQTKPGSSFIKKLAIEIGYNFLKRNCRGPDVALRVPPASLLEVGMVYVL